MSFFTKIENLINHVLTMIIEFMGKLVRKMIPQTLSARWARSKLGLKTKIGGLKSAPQYLKAQAFSTIALLKATKLKTSFKESYEAAMAKYQDKKPQSFLGKLKKLFLTPVLLISNWVSGLNATQTLVLLTFTGASLLSMIQVIFSGQRLMNHHMEAAREPASIEEDIPYERPDYYKKQTRHFEVTNLRLPVYIGTVNELKSVDIDFIATVSNRESRIFLEKNEFQFRDHLINEMEPMIATFPLEEEGKEVLRAKLEKEINAYLKNNGLEGWVTDLKLTYILAN